MADYVHPVAAMLDAAREPVVLLGHSLGGASVSYLAEHHHRKIRRLIYLAAYMCPPGLAVRDCGQWPENGACESYLLIDPSGPENGSAINVANRDHLRNAFYADCSEHDIGITTANVSRVNPLPPMLWLTRLRRKTSAACRAPISNAASTVPYRWRNSNASSARFPAPRCAAWKPATHPSFPGPANWPTS